MRGPRSTTALVAALVVAVVVAPVAALPLAGGGTPAAVSADPTPRSTADTTDSGPAAAVSSLWGAGTVPPVPTDRRTRNPVTPESNTTAYLALDGETETSRIGSVTLDAAASVASDGARTRGVYRTSRLRESFTAREGNRSAQRAVLQRAASRLDARIVALERWEATALDRYNDGEISTRSYLRELAAIDAAAGSLGETTTLLSRYSDAVGDPVSPGRIAAFKTRLLPLEGPVRDRARAAMTGEEPATRIYVETSAEGVVLATVERGPFVTRYVREATVPSARDPDGADQFAATGDGLSAARDRVQELYPWVAENQNGLNIGTYGGEPYLYQAAVYSVAIDHPHGTSRTGDLVTFLDGATREPFREIQYKDLSTVPTELGGSNTSGNVTLRVERTRSGGPMRVTVTNATTGEPLTATVRVDGEPAGTTDLDGSRWLVAPRSPARVTVVADDTTVSTLVFTDAPPSG